MKEQYLWWQERREVPCHGRWAKPCDAFHRLPRCMDTQRFRFWKNFADQAIVASIIIAVAAMIIAVRYFTRD